MMIHHLPPSRVKGLSEFLKKPLSIRELADLLWPGHRMAKVNAAAVVRELLLGGYVASVGKTDRYEATDIAAPIIANPPWICRYCTLDITGSRRKLWAFSCEGCPDIHRVCRFCRRHLVRATGDFPYEIKLRACPGKIEIPKPKPKERKKKSAEPALRPALAQSEFQF